ncbi:MAG: peptide synthetase [Acidobacteria bacterium]|nr:MAG: peptide synthetase [Acidobacteriota bacterium]
MSGVVTERRRRRRRRRARRRATRAVDGLRVLSHHPTSRPGAAATGAESILAEVLAGVLRVDRVSVESDFFEDARVRKRGDLPPISMKDDYAHPTVRRLAEALADVAPAPAKPAAMAPELPTPTNTREYVLCGALQLVCFLGYSYVATVVAGAGYEWVAEGSNAVALYGRLVLAGGAGFFVVSTVPILAKWMLIGRWKPGQQIRLWSLAYVRFWIVKTLIRINPCAMLFVGSPLYVLYLKALGTKIGPGVVIFSKHLPVCTDLLTIGAGTVIRRDSFFNCYRAHAGRIETGTVTLGRDAVIGEWTVLDIDTSMGDGAQLGHASALHRGQAVPAGQRWHGSPAQRTEVNYLRVAPAPCGTLRRARFGAFTLLTMLLVYVPFAEGSLFLIAAVAPSMSRLVDPGAASTDVVTLGQLVIDALQASALSFFGFIFVGLPLAFTVPRVLNLFLKPHTAYPLYGFHDSLRRVIRRLTNIRLFMYLFGDSSFIVHYLSWLGYKLKPIEQTGQNFGTNVTHANPYLCSVGTGTMVADGLAIINEEVSSTSFCVTRVLIGTRNFLGNNVTYPAGGRTGDNCLLATKVMVPLDGKIREGVGLLGAPCFEIPRTVERDTRFDHLRTGEQFRRALAAKNRYNIRTIGVFLFARWLEVFLLMLLGLAGFELYDRFAHVATAALLTVSVVFGGVYAALVDRCVAGFRSLQPTYCSIYHPDFWLQERLWKTADDSYLKVFDGTPFKSLIWQLMGVRIGRRVFDDGVHISERTLTTIGDGCTLNAGSTIQCHSQEDGTFKRDKTTLGAGCTVGVGALVHYGVTMGDGSVLAADSFLMKGEDVPAHARWGGNPAREL